MCGIAGLIAKKEISRERRMDFTKSCDLLSHRGPDHKGIFEEDNILLVHHRLSIIDLDERSNQPFYSLSKKLVTVYNGEIYNFKDLQCKYKIPTRTTSDTEIMLESFDLHKKEVIQEWNGIFAVAIYNREEKEFHLVRDRFGVKPLYIYEDDEVVAFASEAKVILDWLKTFKINMQGLAQYMWYGNTTGKNTMIEGLKKLEPGTQMVFDSKSGNRIQTNKFWSITSNVPKRNIPESEAIKELKNKLEKAVERQLVADVPLGVLLSGGVDSSAIVAFASKHSIKKLDTYTVSYDYNIGGESEVPKAKMIAEKFNTNHQELHIRASDVKQIFSDLVFQYDEPFADTASLPLYQLARECSLDKKVILQGDGGDELFAGYDRYNILNNYTFWKYASFLYPLGGQTKYKERLKRFNFVLNQKKDAHLMAYYLTQDVPYKNPYQVLSAPVQDKLLRENWKEDYEESARIFQNEDLVQKLLYTDTSIILPNTYLEKVDKATMLCSLESRVPFLDNDLADFALSLPSGQKVKRGDKKYLLKKALSGLIPEEILYGPKRGFDVPYKHWLRNDLYEFAKDSFMASETNIIDKNNCLDLLEKHKKGIADYGPVLWKTLILTHYLNIYRSKITQ